MNDSKLRAGLADYLLKGRAHVSLSDVMKDFPEEYLNKQAKNLPYTAWQLLEHARIAQWDMINFINNPKYEELEWPKDYWPENYGTKKTLATSLSQYKKEIKIMVEIVMDSKNNLSAPIPWGSGQTIIKEVLQIVDHTSYHTGELVLLRRVLGIWKS